MQTIAVNDLGPVDEFSLRMTEPGLWVLYGEPGAGKTTILRTVQLVVDGRTDIKPTKRDGSKAGVARVAGKTLKITKQIRQEGELGVAGLGDLDIASLHSPKFKDAETRDEHRIRTLIRIGGVKADVSLFHSLFSAVSHFDEVVGKPDKWPDDLLEMAATIKRIIEKQAVLRESSAITAKANAKAKADVSAGVDVLALQAALRDAHGKHIALTEQRSNGTKAMAAAQSARLQISNARTTANDVAIATAALEEAIAQKDNASKSVEDLTRLLDEARELLVDSTRHADGCAAALESATKQRGMLDLWERQVAEAEAVPCPSVEEIDAAAEVIAAAAQAISRSAVIREAKKASAESEAFAAQADKDTAVAKKLRTAAAKTQDVLSNAISLIPNCPLRVLADDEGCARLVLKTTRSEAEPFDDLSDGERWPFIFAIAASNNRMIVLPQYSFGELNKSGRLQIDSLASDTGCYVLTA